MGRRHGGIAASLLVLVTFGWYMYEPQPARKDTCATPEEAYIHAQQALAMFSDALNKGKKQMEAAHATTTRIERTIQEQFNKINESSEIQCYLTQTIVHREAIAISFDATLVAQRL